MKDTDTITIYFEGQGEVNLTIAQCRELCSQETAAAEEAASRLAEAAEKGDLITLILGQEELAKLEEALKQAIQSEVQRRNIQFRGGTIVSGS